MAEPLIASVICLAGMTHRMTTRHRLIRAAFDGLRFSGVSRMLAPHLRGRGVILMFHHVRPWHDADFAPNRGLEITPAFLDAVLGHLATLGYDLVSTDDVPRRLSSTAEGRPFAALTFDDGYRDFVDHALPILQRHRAPFTLYVTTGFADRTATLWWLDLEHAVAALDRLDLGGVEIPAATPRQKSRAFGLLYRRLRSLPEPAMRMEIARLAAKAGVDSRASVGTLCLDWSGIRSVAENPLATIGVHTITHPMLAKHDLEIVHRELAEARVRIEAETGRPALHLAYPVGDVSSAGPREFGLARRLRFATAVTTRPGVLAADHADRLTELPRLSVNGHHQRLADFDVLLSGAPFALLGAAGRRIA